MNSTMLRRRSFLLGNPGLIEALFVDTLRRYVAGLPEGETGCLSGPSDPVVGKSLGLLRPRVDHSWTIADLAKQIGLSRSALVERFTRYLSEPPIDLPDRMEITVGGKGINKDAQGRGRDCI